MPTTIIRVSSTTLVSAVQRAAETLARGGVVALPTDTVYGLAARADSDDAVERLFAVKRRPETNPLPILLPAASSLPRAASEVPAAAAVLAAAFWPGPLTLVLPRVEEISSLVTAGLPTVGVRVPDDAVARAVLRACGFLVAVTSANLAGEPPATDDIGVISQLGGAVDLVLAAGTCPGGVPSTVVRVEDGEPVILRPGALSLETLRAALGAPAETA
jgi:L-threonylcarbamoyladenylate synthase